MRFLVRIRYTVNGRPAEYSQQVEAEDRDKAVAAARLAFKRVRFTTPGKIRVIRVSAAKA